MRDATDQQIAGRPHPGRARPEHHPVRRIESLARPAPPVSLALPPRMGRHGGQAVGPHSSGPRGLVADGLQQRLDGLPNVATPASQPTVGIRGRANPRPAWPRRSPDAAFFITLLDYPDCRGVLGYGV